MHEHNNAGTLEVITFRATRSEHPFYESLMALVRGSSTGHIALRITFDDRKLYEKYIENEPGIIYRTYKDKRTQQDMFEVYLSFWPFSGWAPTHHLSTLRPHNFDCEQSGNYSRFDYTPEAAAYFQPLHKYTQSKLPLLRNLPLHEMTLPPTIILHSSRLGLAYGNSTTREENSEIVRAAEKYVKKYHAWRTAVINEQNAKLSAPNNTEQHAKLKRDAHICALRLRISKRLLKDLMFPDKAINDDEFDNELDSFISYGYPERDSVTLPLVYNATKTAGLQIEPVLKKIKHIAQNPADYPYNVLGLNCAKIVYLIIAAGLKNSPYAAIRREFILPWFVRWLGITITPALMLHCAIKLQQLLATIRSRDTVKIETPHGIEIAETSQPKVHPRAQAKPDYGLQQTSTMLEFSHDKSEQEELPTTRSAMLSKLLESCSEYTRS